MKIFLFILIYVSSLVSASVDVRLYEGKDTEQYYQEIKNQIDTAAAKGVKNLETIKDERIQLSRLRQAYTQKISVEPYDTKALDSKSISTNIYFDTLEYVSNLEIKTQKNEDINDEIQSKLTFLKQNIEDITEDEKEKLLSYQLQFAYYKLQQKIFWQKMSS